jgi:hypothetical protein
VRVHEMGLAELLDAAEGVTALAVAIAEEQPLLADVLLDWSSLALEEALTRALAGDRQEAQRRARRARSAGN